MTRHFGAAQRDRVLALLAAALALTYVVGARGLEDSLLSDAVGAGGVPQAVGVTMLVAAIALFGKSFISAKRGMDTVPAIEADSATDGRSFVLRTVGLVLILCVYAALLPLAGYPLSISLLVLAAGWLAGAPLRLPLLLCATTAGPVMWGLFGFLLQVRMPLGTLWG